MNRMAIVLATLLTQACGGTSFTPGKWLITRQDLLDACHGMYVAGDPEEVTVAEDAAGALVVTATSGSVLVWERQDGRYVRTEHESGDPSECSLTSPTKDWEDVVTFTGSKSASEANTATYTYFEGCYDACDLTLLATWSFIE